ncbi:MAG: hypothetical protein AAGF31_00430 [Planctomycetota bacterium]
MTLKCKFLEPWRGYKKDALGDLKPDLAEQLAADGIVEIVEGPPILAAEAATAEPAGSEAVATLQRQNAELRQKLQACSSAHDGWKAKAEALTAEVDKLRASIKPADTASDPPADQQATDGELFPELNVSDDIKKKMAAAGWKTVQDVIDFGNANNGLVSAEGIGKVSAEAITDAIKEYQAK